MVENEVIDPPGMSATITMRRGVIALVDVLGFKGIWRRYPEEAVKQHSAH
jgi:hypothetical protein